MYDRQNDSSWLVLKAFAAEKTTHIFGEIIRGVFEDMKKHMRSIMRRTEQSSKEPLSPETALDLSAASSRSSRDATKTILKSPYSDWGFNGYLQCLGIFFHFFASG